MELNVNYHLKNGLNNTKNKHMAEQSAVEWLETNFPDIGKSIGKGTSLEIHAKFQHAERMHEKQIKEAYGHGQNNGCSYLSGDPYANLITAEQYYQQTFKK
jgi:hypothetical protein